MIKFIFKALLRDKNRSLIPILVVTIGVTLTIVMVGFMRGVIGDMVDQTANFQTGHLKVMTRAYADNSSQMPNDLAILGADELLASLDAEYNDYIWTERISTGGIVDYLDADGASISQGTVGVMAVNLMNKELGELARLNILPSIVRGGLPSASNEVLLSDDFTTKMGMEVGDTISFMGSTMNGSMTFGLYKISGTLRFGNSVMDRGMMIMDISDAKSLLDMADASSEILGFSRRGLYFDEEAISIAEGFNKKYSSVEDEFSPVMLPLREQNAMGEYLDYVSSFTGMFIFIFLLVMSVVLWNTGLIGGIRRYHEYGIRLALGESKGHIYWSGFYEAVLVGVVASCIGTAMGMALVYLLEVKGIDISGMIPDSSMMIPSVMRAKLTSDLFYIGFIPGVLAMSLGTLLSGFGIYKRQTSLLMKEMEL